MLTYLGNKEILNKEKVGILASRKIATLSVLPLLDWATEIYKKEDITVVSGFQSRLEQEVLDILLRGKCNIVVVLSRGIYKQLPKQYEEAMQQNRLLIVTQEKENVTRTSEPAAQRRNEYICNICDTIVFASVSKESSLYPLMMKYKEIKTIKQIPEEI